MTVFPKMVLGDFNSLLIGCMDCESFNQQITFSRKGFHMKKPKHPIWTFMPTQNEIDEIKKQERKERHSLMLRKLAEKGFTLEDLKSI